MSGVELQELLLGSQASTLDIAGKNFVHAMDAANKGANTQAGEVSLVEAAAAKELGKMGNDPRFMPNTQPSS